MRGKMIFQTMRQIDPQLILDAAPDQKKHFGHAWIKWSALAACLILTVAALFWFLGDGSAFPISHTHTFGGWQTVTEATCSAQGVEQRTCFCGEKESRFTSLLPHFAGEWVIEKEPTIKLPTPEDPTQREPGLKCQFCDRCGAKLDEEVIPATGSLGLAYAISPDGKTFTVAGIGNCTDEDIIVPENFCGYHITSVMKGAFSACTSVKSITLPETIRTIEDRAFQSSSLKSISLPVGLEKIGEMAFSDCDSLKEIVIPSNVKIGKRAFEGCYALRRVVISGGTKVIEAYTFQDCWLLESVVLPEGLESIGDMAFYNCSKLTGIHFPSTLTSIGEHAFARCSSLQSIVLPQGLKTVEIGVFSYCYLLEIAMIPSGVTKIENIAFKDCYKLLNVSIPDSVTAIGWGAFENCSSLERIVLPEGLEVIEHNLFSGCYHLQEIEIPDSVKQIGENAFAFCTKLIQAENGIGYVDTWAVVYDDSVSHIVLKDGTVGVIEKLLNGSETLVSVTVPRSVKYIGAGTFARLYNLKEIIYMGTREEWDAIEKGEGWDQNSNEYSIIFASE